MNFKIPTAKITNITFRQEPSGTGVNGANGVNSINGFNKNEPPKNGTAKNGLERVPSKDKFEISIGYINDTHGQTNNMMRILSGLKGDLKLSAGDNDIGDEKNKPVHRVTYKFLNMADIKATALGNHEMDASQADLIDSLKEYKGDILTVNMKKDSVEKQNKDVVKKLGRANLDKHLKPSKIIEVKGEKIGLLGTAPTDLIDRLTHPDYHKDCHVDELEGSIISIQKEVDNLRKQGVDKIVLLSHMGLTKDREIAQKTEGIDVIIGGHTHELVEGIKAGDNLLYSKTGEPVIITQAGRDGNYFGQLNLVFDKEGVITKAQNNLGDTSQFHKNMVNQYVFDSIMGKPEVVGYIKDAPPPPKSLLEENPHANFICDVMKAETDSDIALWHNCGIRNFFHKGVIDSRDIKDISPFLDYVVVAEVSEKTLVDLFKKAIEDSYKSKAGKPGVFAVSGLDYTVNPDKGILTQMNYTDKKGNIHSIDINNPSEDKKYKVVTDEFLMSAGADYIVLAKEDEYIKKYPYDKDVMVCNYLKKHKEPIVINQTGRIKYSTDKN